MDELIEKIVWRSADTIVLNFKNRFPEIDECKQRELFEFVKIEISQILRCICLKGNKYD